MMNDAEYVIFGNIKIFTITNTHGIYDDENIYDVSYVISHPEYKIKELWKNDIAILRVIIIKRNKYILL